MKTAIELILAEQKRVSEQEGYTPEHDDMHDQEELALAAACYAYPPNRAYPGRLEEWPFEPESFKETPNDRVRELVKAAYLITAEIERLIRLRKQDEISSK